MITYNKFETLDDAVELGLQSAIELRREEWLEEYRILCLDMHKNIVYFNLFEDFDEYKTWYKLINRDNLYYLLILPQTTDEEVKDWITSSYKFDKAKVFKKLGI